MTAAARRAEPVTHRRFSSPSDLNMNPIQDQLNGTLNETFSNLTGFSRKFYFPHIVTFHGKTAVNCYTTADLAGVRCFVPEQEMESRIMGGQEAWAHSWPWQVSLQFATMPACGGAIIGPLWVMSAAHCFSRSEFNCISCSQTC